MRKWPFTRPPGWLSEGENPDYRFSLANERTFLAWIRTALALLAGAVAVVQLVPAFGVRGSRTTLALVLSVTGGGLAAFAYCRWAGNERAMRRGEALPFTPAFALAAAVVSLIAGVIVVLVIARA